MTRDDVAKLGACVAALTIASCISHKPVRTFDSVNSTALPATCPAPNEFKETRIASLQAGGALGTAEQHGVSCVSEERHRAVTNSPTSLPHDGFTLHVLEFDDEGQPWNRARQDESFDALERELLRGPAVVLTFVHGWKNDASVCNDNLACFREVLEILAKGEKLFAGPSATPRRVIGIYIGWRGGTIRAKLLQQLTFWGRKHTAHIVGDNGAVTAVVERLRAIVRTSPSRQSAPVAGRAFSQTSLVFVGHSFGGALLFSALATSLNASVGAAIQGGNDAPGGMPQRQQRAVASARPVLSDEAVRVRSSGDLTVLVNPAMEASRFANLAQTRNLAFQKEQVPIFMTLASEADWAVGGFFPVGQAFATVARAARSRDIWFSMEKGFGLYEPYHTHRLALKPQHDIPLPRNISGECRCSSNLGAFGDALVTRLDRLYGYVHGIPPPASEEEKENALKKLRLAAYMETLYSRLEPIRDVDPNNPFIMATVDPAIVGGHSDIFNPRFIDFLIEYVIQSEIKRSLVGDYGQESRR